ncbi:MAG TPA: hypothetical protein VG253_03220 [Streptosporangiaceae bacterium]|nr:hypothetical protein [Streptosporangiaceae bacterium]
MAAWEYAELIVGRSSRGSWRSWEGPDGKILQLQALAPTKLLTEYGQQGWEIAAAYYNRSELERVTTYVLKRRTDDR